MSLTASIINGLAALLLAAAAVHDRKKAVAALKKALAIFVSLLPLILTLILLIGLLFSMVPQEVLERFLGKQSGVIGTAAAAAVGAVLHIPALLAFPLAASLIERGASVSAAAAFITTLTMVGFVTLPLEIRELGKRFALLRNGFSLIAALIIAFMLGVVL